MTAMDGKKVGPWIAVTLWVMAIVLWPLPSNLRLTEDSEERRTASTGEGLYKSDLTEANFGMLGVRFYEATSGQRSWNIRSEFAEMHREAENYAFLKAVDADFFAGESRNIIHTKSDYGRSHFGRSLVELEGNVSLQSLQGYRFTMDTLDYDGKKHRFKSPDVVHMKGPDVQQPLMFLTGTGLDADLTKETFLIRRNTRARRKLSNSQWVRVQANQGQFEPQANRAVFKDRVKAHLPDLTVESDQLEMRLGDASNELMRATGRVTLKHKNRRGRSQSADIEVGKDRVILEGDAYIEGDGNELRGTKITLYTKADEVEVEQAKGNLNR